MPVTDATIGSQSFMKLEGELSRQYKNYADITRSGVDGRAWREEGKRGQSTTLTTWVDVADGATAASTLTTYKNMVGTVVSISKNFRGTSQTLANFLILDVEEQDQFDTINAVGGTVAGRHVLVCRWTVAYAST